MEALQESEVKLKESYCSSASTLSVRSPSSRAVPPEAGLSPTPSSAPLSALTGATGACQASPLLPPKNSTLLVGSRLQPLGACSKYIEALPCILRVLFICVLNTFCIL